jgi:hypothetical protein
MPQAGRLSGLHPVAMPTKPAKLDPDHRRALHLLASSRDGCPEALFLAHGFTAALIEPLMAAGHVTAATAHMRGRRARGAGAPIADYGRRPSGAGRYLTP